MATARLPITECYEVTIEAADGRISEARFDTAYPAIRLYHRIISRAREPAPSPIDPSGPQGAQASSSGPLDPQSTMVPQGTIVASHGGVTLIDTPSGEIRLFFRILRKNLDSPGGPP